MSEPLVKLQLPPIPAKRYFTIGEVSELCGVKPHVLRYWEQEFTQLKPVKRRGNRRYYQLLYEQGFTISGARNRLDGPEFKLEAAPSNAASQISASAVEVTNSVSFNFEAVKTELTSILTLLRAATTHAA
ncbi:MAG: hypothetical protein RLZZ379_794 [Pseudomonadota bacterium]